jgi:hypothetical protein
MQLWQRLFLVGLAAMTPAYIVLYIQGYHRPSHHPASAGIVESIRVGLEAQAMALGPAATGLWPFVGVAVVIAGSWVTYLLLRSLRFGSFDRATDRGSMAYSIVGLLLFIVAGAAVAFGIGWGRSGFHDDMGFAWRYGWITFPPVAAAYFTWLVRGGRVSLYGPAVLCLAVAILAPVNTISGFRDAELKLKPISEAWEADVRSGMKADEVIAKYFPEYPPTTRRQMADALRIMHAHRYTYYGSLGREEP